MQKAEFWKLHEKTAINERQRFILNKLFDGLEGKRAIQIQSLSMIDAEPDKHIDQGQNLLRQKNAFYFTMKPDAEKTKTERYMNGHYNRYMHCVRDFTNPYWLGRHNFKHPAVRKTLHILKYLFAPYPDFFARKLQIKDKIPESNVKQGWGFQHMVDMRELQNQYDERKNFPLLGLTDVKANTQYYDLYIRPENPSEMMLSGVYANLYGNSNIDY
jgi:hypothetical protein